jgi:predicted CopG family antitoxin
MTQPLRKIEPEARSYSERIRKLVEADKVGGARRLLAEALERGDHDEDLSKWQRVLAPGKVLGTSPELDPDRTPEFQWLETHWRDYRKQWVALAEDRLLAHSAILEEVLSATEGMKLGRRPLLYYIDGGSSNDGHLYEGTDGTMTQALKEVEPETRSYSKRILKLVEADKVGEARRLLAEALERGSQKEDLAYWQKVLAKGGPGRPVKGESDFDRTPDIQWIREHSETYRGQWVALLGGELLAHSQSLEEVVQVLERNRPARSPLIHYID